VNELIKPVSEVSLPTKIKYRPWLVIFLTAAVWSVSGCAGPASLNEVAAEDTIVQESVPVEADSRGQIVSAVSGTPGAASTQEVYQATPVGFTEEGYPYLGDPDAPVTLEEYSDFLCPFCARHFEQTVPAILDEYVSSGQVKYVFRDMPLVELHPTAPRGHVAAWCAADQGAPLFWAMHDELFKRQNEWSRLPDPSDFLAGVAESVGVDMAAYQECLASGGKDTQVEASVAAGEALGFNGTPSFQFIQGESGETYTLVGAHPVDTFSQWLGALIAGEVPPQEGEEAAEPTELPFWANVEGLALDPERPGFTMAGDQYKGNPDAKLVVIEFSDFQCPACQRHTLETQPVLDEAFVETGDIMWVFKHFPLKEHAQALAAAAAAECAADQDRFWEMQHLLYETQDQWAVEDPDVELIKLAEQLDLDMDLFTACLNSREPLERVLGDVFDAQGVVGSTPTFIGVYAGSGGVLRGARESDEFVTVLQSMLESANAGEK
jgi:protein-disulfide isomerase